MKIRTFVSIALSSLLLLGCGSSSDSSPAKDNGSKENSELNNVDDRALAQKIIFNKSYKDSVSAQDHVDWFLVESAKANHEYYLHLKNLGDKNENYSYTFVPYSILDDNGEILKAKLSTVLGEKTYKFTANSDGNLYIKFDSRYSLGDYSSRFEFEVQTGFEDGLVQDTTTFEYNDFQKVAYPIEGNRVYTSSATGTTDSADWYVIENIDSAKENYLHLINLGDKNENSSMNPIKCEIIDEKGKILDINLATTVKEKTYTFTPIQDGKVYLHFYTHLWGSIYGDMRYSFEIK